MKSWKLLASLFLLHNIFSVQNVFAQELADIKEEVVVDAETVSSARDMAVQQVVSQVVEKFGLELLGEQRYTQNKAKIQNVIVREVGKFAPLQKADLLTQNSPYKVAVTLKVSPQNLRQLFERTGFLTSKFDSGQVMTFITVLDSVRARALKWWISDNQDDDFLIKLNGSLHKEIGSSLKNLNFQVIDPVEWGFKGSLSQQFQKDYFRKDDFLNFENTYKIPLVVRGQVEVVPSSKVSNAFRIQVRLAAVLTSQGTIVAETSRSVETESGDVNQVVAKNMDKVFKETSQDLGDQLSSALQRGLLESSMLQLSLLGDLSYFNIENFRSTLLKNIGNIRYLSERSIESNKRIFDVDYAGTADELAKRIETLKFQGFRVQSSGVSTKSLELRIKN